MSDELERAFASLSSQPRPDCPPLDDVWRAAQGEAPAAEVERLAEHMAGCASCAQAWRLAVGLRDPSRRAWSSWRLSALAGGFAAAAAAALAIVVHRPADVERGNDVAAPRALVSVAPASECVLRWTPVPGASYEVTASREDGTQLFRARVTGVTSVAVPAAALRGQRRIFWRVRAQMDDGRAVDSGSLELSLR